MTEKNAIELKDQLKDLGFINCDDWIDANRNNPASQFTIYNYREISNDQLQFGLQYTQDVTSYFKLTAYELTTRSIRIPEEHLVLAQRVKRADELYNAYLNGNQRPDDNAFIQTVLSDLEKLKITDRAAAELLVFKYWPQTEYRAFVRNEDILKHHYERTVYLPVAPGLAPTATEAYNLLKEMKNEHVIADDLLAIAHKELSGGNEFVAYNTMAYYLGKPDMYFFKTRDEANEFAINNISDLDNFKVMRAGSIEELLKQISYGELLKIQLLTKQNMSIMIEKNFDYLKDNLRNHGFGETLNPLLEEQLKKGIAEFSLAFKTEFNKKEMEATLHFKKSDKTDMYFFNKYDASVNNEKDANMKQTFYINNGWGVTMKEAYNLLNGRAVHKELTNKEGEKYKAWVELDFSTKDKHGNYERKQYHENYGYAIKEALSFYPIRELLKEESLKDLVKSLEKGNVQMVTFEKEGKEIRMFIQADPKHKDINVYDNRMAELKQDERKALMVEPAPTQQLNGKEQTNQPAMQQGQEVKKDAEKGKELNEKKDEKKSLLPKKEKGNGLIEKKRTATKKGHGIH